VLECEEFTLLLLILELIFQLVQLNTELFIARVWKRKSDSMIVCDSAGGEANQLLGLATAGMFVAKVVVEVIRTLHQ